MLSTAPPASFRAHYQALVASVRSRPTRRRRTLRTPCGAEERLSSYKPLRKPRPVGGCSATRTSAAAGSTSMGEVGRGKTMLMDLFFQQAPSNTKRRAHFTIMAEVHRADLRLPQNIARGEIAMAT